MEKYEKNKLYELYKKSLHKWEGLIQILEDVKNGKRKLNLPFIFSKVSNQCSFCHNTEINPITNMSINCNYCKIDKKICDDYSRKGLISLFKNIYGKVSEYSFTRKVLYFVNFILKSLKWNMNNILLTCHHHWKWTGSGYCEECGEFFKGKKMKFDWFTHGNMVSQCTKCGLMYEPEYGYITCEEIENFKFNEIEIHHIKDVQIRGIW